MSPLQHLRANRDFYNISAIEKRAKLRPTMLNKYMKSGRMKPKYEKQLGEALKSLNIK